MNMTTVMWLQMQRQSKAGHWCSAEGVYSLDLSCKLSCPGGNGAEGALREQWTHIQAGFVRPLLQWQASHILCKYALLRSAAEAFSPVRSLQILISQVTVVGFQPVCAADITIQASQINLATLSLHFL